VGWCSWLPAVWKSYIEQWWPDVASLLTTDDSWFIDSAVMLNEVKTSRPRPELWGRGQDYEAEAKNNHEKVPNND